MTNEPSLVSALKRSAPKPTPDVMLTAFGRLRASGRNSSGPKCSPRTVMGYVPEAGAESQSGTAWRVGHGMPNALEAL